ncbi:MULTISPECIES: hypothetical protein [Lysobacter]|jgi:hypothetical protein|uniref:Uncharacterized protein n=1 Tax=Lysobacter gummosus TaxID=262324 RepID=A0ABY3X617_9GAMM|nr:MULTISPECIES: hypothetical protein [Lysobacter]ALN92427.1 hypothetical protein LG3211_3481 [Lysobacter gummosus]MBT2749086.1 hypothetical protein [Lysobacter sp. ISL-42]MBT2751400.1 hypothetical protein [Lysobacter sp. ISL-50]MBT2777342.1 hypothetical protein [Lysobacter sp. ISL-54]MBT2781582.1 hypothetical protein [Lysobacter sp. ISL-52]
MFKTNKARMRTLSLSLLAAGLAVTAAAYALPVPNNDESYNFTFYSDASRTVVVGERIYGNCGDPYSWGRMTPWSSYYKTTCTPP